ncbi:tetratricopeptide repeat protein, partial [bacterium]|nr:tetratricopeptide repeat protein [bacterium]
MEIIKFKVVLVSLLLTTVVFSQTKSRQTAFSKSYEYEKSANYSAAIKEVKGVYDANDYFNNIRLGWLLYLGKNYAESIKYYDKAIALKPYAIEARFGCVKPLSAIESWEKVKVHYLQILKID